MAHITHRYRYHARNEAITHYYVIITLIWSFSPQMLCCVVSTTQIPQQVVLQHVDSITNTKLTNHVQVVSACFFFF